MAIRFQLLHGPVEASGVLPHAGERLRQRHRVNQDFHGRMVIGAASFVRGRGVGLFFQGLHGTADRELSANGMLIVQKP